MKYAVAVVPILALLAQACGSVIGLDPEKERNRRERAEQSLASTNQNAANLKDMLKTATLINGQMWASFDNFNGEGLANGMTYVDPREIATICNAVGYRLPTQAEVASALAAAPEGAMKSVLSRRLDSIDNQSSTIATSDGPKPEVITDGVCVR